MKIVGIVGCARSGKDTAYKLIKSIYPGTERLAFADSLKSKANAMLEAGGLDADAFTEDNKEKELIRPLLVWLGEFARKKDEFCWVKEVAWHINDLAAEGCPMVIITDVRYTNEADFIVGAGGRLLYLDAPVPAANLVESGSIHCIKNKYLGRPEMITVWNHMESKKQFLDDLLATGLFNV